MKVLNENVSKNIMNKLNEGSLKEHIENINDNPTYLKIINFIDNIIYSEEDEDRKQICTQLKKDMDIFGNLKESEKLKEEYSNRLGGEPTDFINDLEMLRQHLETFDMSKFGTHLAAQMIIDFVDTINSQIEMTKNKYDL